MIAVKKITKQEARKLLVDAMLVDVTWAGRESNIEAIAASLQPNLPSFVEFLGAEEDGGLKAAVLILRDQRQEELYDSVFLYGCIVPGRGGEFLDEMLPTMKRPGIPLHAEIHNSRQYLISACVSKGFEVYLIRGRRTIIRLSKEF